MVDERIIVPEDENSIPNPETDPEDFIRRVFGINDPSKPLTAEQENNVRVLVGWIHILASLNLLVEEWLEADDDAKRSIWLDIIGRIYQLSAQERYLRDQRQELPVSWVNSRSRDILRHARRIDEAACEGDSDKCVRATITFQEMAESW